MRRGWWLMIVLVACGHRPGTGKGTGKGTGTAELDWSSSGVDWTKVPAPGPDPTFTLPEAATFTLDSGVQVVLVENHRLPLVSVRAVSARAGAREDGAKLGLAALTADLLLEGAGDLDARALPEAVEELGASLDTGLSEDASTVWLDTLASTLEDSLGLLSDVLRRPTLTKADFERIRDDVIADLELRPQEPRRVANLVFDQHVLGDHPYGQPASGYVGTVSKLTVKDVQAFWRDHYTPDATTIVVAGDVDRATLEPILARTLGDWKRPAKPVAEPEPPALPPAPTPSIVVVDRPKAAQSVVMIGRRGRAANDPDFFAAEVANTAAGGTFMSRLNGRLREELGYTYGMYSAFWRGEWTGTWAITSSLKTGKTVDGVNEALRIIDELRTHELPADELAKTQSFLIKARPQGFETNAGIAGEYQVLVVQRLPLDWLGRWDEGVRGVTAAQARELAAEAWADLSIVVVGDWSKIGDGLAKLGLPIAHVDAEGHPVTAK